MNKQRKCFIKGSGSVKPRLVERKKTKNIKAPPAAEQLTDFSEIPNGTICQSIQLLLNELISRGYPLYDFDRKNRSLKRIQIIGSKIYFLATEEDSEEKTADRV